MATKRFASTSAMFVLLSSALVSGQANNRGTAPAHESVAKRPTESPSTTMRSWLPEKEIKVFRLIFVGTPVLSSDEQEVVAGLLAKLHYEDSKDGLKELRLRIEDAWQERGFFTVKVGDLAIQLLQDSAQQKTVAITAPVEAGTQYRLGGIGFNHNRQFSGPQLRSHFPLQENEIFDTHKIREGIESVRKQYGSRGFINFAVVPDTRIAEDQKLAYLTLDVDEGKQFRIGKVEIRALAPRPSQRLIQESGLVTGNVFDDDWLETFLEHNKSTLPAQTRACLDTERRINERESTVDLILDFRYCPAIAND